MHNPPGAVEAHGPPAPEAHRPSEEPMAHRPRGAVEHCTKAKPFRQPMRL
jgi:hypothetical protein